MGTCHGDSGGPSIARQFVNGVYRYTLLGVVSGGPDPLQCGSLPDFYTYIGHEEVISAADSSSILYVQMLFVVCLFDVCLLTAW